MSNRKTKPDWQKYEGVYIIPVMGPTGAGKSSFINQLFGKEMTKVGHKLQSCTVDLQPITIPAELIQHCLPLWSPALQNGSKVIIVDTPGFDDTSVDDSETLKRIVDWLANTYGAGAKLAGVIYLQDISHRRVTATTKRNFEVFEKLCGPDACKSVVLGTTQWQKLHPADITVANDREKELRANFWRDMLKKGSTIHRVDNRNPKTSPWNLIEHILCKDKPATLLIQEELVDMGKSFSQTEAAEAFHLPQAYTAAELARRIEVLLEILKEREGTKEVLRAAAKELKALKQKRLFQDLRAVLYIT